MPRETMAAADARFERETLEAEFLAMRSKENFEREKSRWRLGIYHTRALDVCVCICLHCQSVCVRFQSLSSTSTGPGWWFWNGTTWMYCGSWSKLDVQDSDGAVMSCNC